MSAMNNGAMFVKKKCPPFCNNYCSKKHHKLLVSLLNVHKNNRQSLEKFKKAVEQHKDIEPEKPIPDPDKSYRYPLLHWAAVLGKASAIEYLINNGHPVDLKSKEKGETAMHRAVRCLYNTLSNKYSLKHKHMVNRFESITKMLADALFIVDDNGNTPLHACAIYITELNEPAEISFYKSAFELMINKVLQIEGEEYSSTSNVINWPNREGNTLLHILAGSREEESTQLVKILLENQANFELKNINGKSSFEIANETSGRMAESFDCLKRKRHHEYSSPESPETDLLTGDMARYGLPEDANEQEDFTRPDYGDIHGEDVSQVENISKTGRKRQKLAPQKLVIKPTLVSGKTDNLLSESDHSSIPSSPEPTADNGTKSVLAHLCSPPVSVGTITNDDYEKTAIQPNLANLLKTVGKEKPVLELAENSKEELEEKVRKSEQASKGFATEREMLHAECNQMVVEINTKRREIENLKKSWKENEKNIKKLDGQIIQEDFKQTELKNEIIVYEKILKCLDND